MRSRRHPTLRDQEAILRPKSPFAFGKPLASLWSSGAVSGKAGSLDRKWLQSSPLNIGRILLRQSHQPLLHAANGKSCRRAEKAVAAVVPQLTLFSIKPLKYIIIF
jgi:hypothetical protein